MVGDGWRRMREGIGGREKEKRRRREEEERRKEEEITYWLLYDVDII